MKFNISTPPMGGEDNNEKLERLTAWLYKLAEELNVVLSNLGSENFNSETKNLLSSISNGGTTK